MKVIANKVGGLSINPQTIVYFTTGEKLEPGVKGLSEENIKRLIELKFVDVDDDSEISDDIENMLTNNVTIPNAYDFEAITDKNELAEYAKEIYEVELDTSKSVKKMITELKKFIEGDK